MEGNIRWDDSMAMLPVSHNLRSPDASEGGGGPLLERHVARQTPSRRDHRRPGQMARRKSAHHGFWEATQNHACSVVSQSRRPACPDIPSSHHHSQHGDSIQGKQEKGPLWKMICAPGAELCREIVFFSFSFLFLIAIQVWHPAEETEHLNGKESV